MQVLGLLLYFIINVEVFTYFHFSKKINFSPQKLGRIPIKTPLRAWPSFGSQPRYEASGDLWVKSRIKRSDYHQVSEAVSSTVAQKWPWCSQVVVKKTIKLKIC